MEIAIGVEVFMNKKEKVLKKIRVIQTIFPWLILLTGIPAVYCWVKEYFVMLEIFYSLAIITGQVVLVLEFILGIISLILFIISIIKKNDTKIIVRGVVNWLYSGVCMVGTFILIILVIGFTYGQGI